MPDPGFVRTLVPDDSFLRMVDFAAAGFPGLHAAVRREEARLPVL